MKWFQIYYFRFAWYYTGKKCKVDEIILVLAIDILDEFLYNKREIYEKGISLYEETSR